MSSVNIIVGIAVMLGALVCYAFISQSVRHKREQRSRLLKALKARSRTFKFMLSGFPSGFLSKDLTMLVQRSLAEVSEQLTKLEPNDPKHLQDFQLATNELSDSQRAPERRSAVSLESQQQVKEVKMCLEELYKYIVRLEQKNAVAKPLANNYRAQIKQLVLQVTVDAYILHGKKAKQAQKSKLALHYFELALNLLMKEAKKGQFNTKISELQQEVATLREAAAEDTTSIVDTDDESKLKADWDQVSAGEDLWKKKNIYD